MQRYDLLLTGKTLPGHKPEAVVVALAKKMRIPQTQALQLLSGQERVIKTNLDILDLVKYRAALNKAGVDVESRAVLPPANEKLLDCPCCGLGTLSRRGADERCSRCDWQDNPQQSSDPAKVLPGINRGLSLNQAREEYRHYWSLDPQRYRPNSYPLRQRVIAGLAALLVMVYCGWSLWTGEMFLWASSRYSSIHVHSGSLLGSEVWLMSAGLLFAAMVGILMIADHYDRRRNEHLYLKAAQACYTPMMAFVGLALTLHGYRTEGLLFAVLIGLVMSVFVAMVFVRRKQTTLKSG